MDAVNYYQKNYEAMQLRFPETAQQISRTQPSSRLEVLVSKNNQPTFSFLDKSNKKILFHSLYNPEKEASDFILSQELARATTLFLFGLGFGYYLKEARRLFKGAIFALEPSLEILKSALENTDLTQELKDRRVFFITDFGLARNLIVLFHLLQGKNFEHLLFCIHPRYKVLVGQYDQWFSFVERDAPAGTFYSPDSMDKNILYQLIDLYLERFKNSDYSDLNAFGSAYAIGKETGCLSHFEKLLFDYASWLYQKKRYAQSLEVFSSAWERNAAESNCSRYSDKRFVQEVSCCYDEMAAAFKDRLENIQIPIIRKNNLKAKINLAHIVGQIVDDTHSPTEVLKNFIEFGNRRKFNRFVFSSEIISKRENPPASPLRVESMPSEIRGKKTIDFFKDNSVPVYLAPLSGNLVDSAVALARQISLDGIEIAFFHSSMVSTIDYMISAWRIIPLQININMGSFMYSRHLDAVTYPLVSTFNEDRSFWSKNNISVFLMPSGVDFKDKIKESKAINRDELSIPPDAVVLITVGNHLYARISEDCLRLLREVILSSDNIYWLIIGGGDFSRQNKFILENGLRDKVKFLGAKKDVFSYLSIADIYVNEFPQGGGMSVLEAMSVALPVVAMYAGSEHLENCGANYVGQDFFVKDRKGFKEFLLALVNSKSRRKEVGLLMQKRYKEEFSPKKMVAAFEDLAMALFEKKCCLS